METTYRYIEREAVRLDDGTDYTRAVFRECDLVYAGGEAHIGGAPFIDCRLNFEGKGADSRDLERAIFRSFYAQGARTLWIDENGNYGPLWPARAI